MNSQKLRCVMISVENSPIDAIREAISSSFVFELVEWQRQYPDESSLLRMLRLSAPDLLVVDFADMARAMRVVQMVQQHAPTTEVLALCEENVTALSTLLRAGVRNYLTPSYTFEQVNDALRVLAEQLMKRPVPARTGGDIITFLPAKPGSGASTIAANTAYFAAGKGGKRTLLADFDNSAGVQSFLFKLRPDHTFRDALNTVQDLDGEMWSRLRSQVKELDILPADIDANTPTDGARVNRLLQFFHRAYDLTMVDLSGQLDAVAIEALLESKRIYLVCTQELACQHLLLRKVERLRRSGLDKQMRLIVNRFLPKHVMTPERISDLVGLPVELTIANNYELANCAMKNGSLVRADSNLGKSYRRLAEILTDNRIEIPKTKHSFLEYIAQPFLRSTTESA